MIPTIFEVMGKAKEPAEDIITFTDYLDVYGRWIKTLTTSTDFINCIKISEDNSYNYYLCWQKAEDIKLTTTYRKIKNQND